jgi:hypothetical protein
MKHSNKTKTFLLIALVFLISTVPSYAALQDAAEDGPDGPPAAPIDDYIVPMIVVAIGIACMYFYKSTKNSAALITKL